MASSGQKKLVSRLTYKQKSGGIAILIFRSNKGRSKEISKKERRRLLLKI